MLATEETVAAYNNILDGSHLSLTLAELQHVVKDPSPIRGEPARTAKRLTRSAADGMFETYNSGDLEHPPAALLDDPAQHRFDVLPVSKSRRSDDDTDDGKEFWATLRHQGIRFRPPPLPHHDYSVEHRKLEKTLGVFPTVNRFKGGKRLQRSLAFGVTNILTASECGYLIRAAESHLQPVDKFFAQKYRKGDRAMFRAPKLADELFRRILPHVQPADYNNRIPLCFNQQGVWAPLCLNECIKIVKYSPDGLFVQHRDAPWVPSPDRASIFTVLVYLNDGFTGGYTEFVSDRLGPRGLHRKSWNDMVLVRPTQGAALIFNHDAWHGGKRVLEGAKWVLRTEMIFQRLHSFTVDRAWKLGTDAEFARVKALYERSLQSLADGNKEAFVELYQHVIDGQREAMLASQRQREDEVAVLETAVVDDVFAVILDFVADDDILSLLLTSKGTYFRVAQSPAWEARCFRTFPAAFSATNRAILKATTQAQLAAYEASATFAHAADFRPADYMTRYAQQTTLQSHFSPAVLALLPAGCALSVRDTAPETVGTVNAHRPASTHATEVATPRAGSNWRHFRLPGAYTSISGMAWHMNLPADERFEVTTVLDAKDSRAIVDSAGNVEFSVLWVPAEPLVDFAYVPLLVTGHPEWFTARGRSREVDNTRVAFQVLRTPAICVVNPAVCILRGIEKRSKVPSRVEALTAAVIMPVLYADSGCHTAKVYVTVVDSQRHVVVSDVFELGAEGGQHAAAPPAAAVAFEHHLKVQLLVYAAVDPRPALLMLSKHDEVVVMAGKRLEALHVQLPLHDDPSAKTLCYDKGSDAVDLLIEGACEIANSEVFRQCCQFSA